MIIKYIAKKYQATEHIKIYLLLGLIVLALMFFFIAKAYDRINSSSPVIFGVTFSPDYAKTLGFDPKKIYQQMFQDLKIKKIRLLAYWDTLEPKPNEFDFKDLDFYVDWATLNNAQVILAIGYKLPRWPECRVPDWLKNKGMKIRQERQLIYLQAIISRYENNKTISAWQIENEPLFSFGECDPVDELFLNKEVAFVRNLSNKPILLTDSGELSSWITPMRLSDYFGTTMYRTVYNPVVGWLPYPLQPWYYRIKSDVIRTFLAPQNKKTITIELQAEPWAEDFIADKPIKEQLEHFTVQDVQDNINFAKKVGTPEIYLWGVEWWYWIKTQGHPEFLDYAKQIIR